MKKLIILLISLFLLGCSASEPVLIGTIFTVTGQNPQLGVSSRNGLDLAIKEWNDLGGFQGRPFEALNFNPESNPEKLPEIVNELESQEIGLVLGPLTSNMATPLLASLKGRDMFVLSPTISTYEVSGLEDNFFRLNMSSDQEGFILGQWLKDQEMNQLALIFDGGNRDFAASIMLGLREGFGSQNLELLYQNDMAGNDRDYRKIAQEAVSSNPKAILIIAGSLDTVALAQQIYKEGYQGSLLGSQWGSTGDVITYGGNAVEGMIFVQDPLEAKNSQEYREFALAYTNFFGREPDFSAQYSYEAAQILFQAMKETGSREPYKIIEYILEAKSFTGLTGEIVFDQFGDILRDKVIVEIREGIFTPLMQ